MVDKDKILDEFKCMFDIVVDDKSGEGGNDYATMAEDKSDAFNESFDTLVEGMSDTVSLVGEDIPDLGYKPEDTTAEDVILNSAKQEDKTDIDDINQKIAADEAKKAEENKTEEEKDIEFDSLEETDIKEDAKTEELKVEEPKEQKKDFIDDFLDSGLSVPKTTFSDLDDNLWHLKSPSSLYDNFYRNKIELIKHFTMGEPIPFEKWFDELSACSVDISSTTFDRDQILRQMDMVQQSRNRVKEIQLRCNRQYYIWKRFLELLRGCLSRVEYLKPIIKQDGLIHEHMRDVELYFSNLEALHRSAYLAEGNLQAAFDTLSRKVSICMELKTGDRYYPRPPATATPEKESAPELEGYDHLPENATAEYEENNFIGWGEIK